MNGAVGAAENEALTPFTTSRNPKCRGNLPGGGTGYNLNLFSGLNVPDHNVGILA